VALCEHEKRLKDLEARHVIVLKKLEGLRSNLAFLKSKWRQGNKDYRDLADENRIQTITIKNFSRRHRQDKRALETADETIEFLAVALERITANTKVKRASYARGIAQVTLNQIGRGDQEDEEQQEQS